jgi:hypothetical protein
MGQTFNSDPPTALKHARDELLLALSAASSEDEADHRSRANVLIREAVSRINEDPGRDYDWSV